jgi:hypothetical protein
MRQNAPNKTPRSNVCFKQVLETVIVWRARLIAVAGGKEERLRACFNYAGAKSAQGGPITERSKCQIQRMWLSLPVATELCDAQSHHCVKCSSSGHGKPT